ncbi:MAG: AEC family transporter [Oscillospiraceae bacterium]|nr:AEC family transporter [Oscillospiraceae bacterium]MBQ7341573.1 AEC family transporter [Oscillospiraceae bacterium]
MVDVFEQVLILLVFCAAGFGLAKKGITNPSHTKILSALEIYVFIPCLTFNNFAKNFTVEYLSDRYVLLIVSIIILVLSYPFAKLLAKPFAKKLYDKSLYHYILMIPNYGYIGYALCQGIYGELGLLDMMIFALPMNVYTNSIAYSTLTGGDGRISIKRIFSPAVYATILGCIVGISGLNLPTVLTDITGKAAACMAPISMLLTGIVISEYRLKELLLRKKSYAVSALRLLGIPALVFGLLKLTSYGFTLLGLPAVGASVASVIPYAVITYCMPCGMNTIVFPKMVGEDCKTGASTVLISTVAALITIPLCVTFLK